MVLVLLAVGLSQKYTSRYHSQEEGLVNMLTGSFPVKAVGHFTTLRSRNEDNVEKNTLYKTFAIHNVEFQNTNYQEL
jgi:hypothetical protein